MHSEYLEGAPTADDLGLKGQSAVLHNIIMTNRHHGQSATRTLAGCACIQITGAEVVPGDFRYHYSRQLDSFILWEVIQVDRGNNTCIVKTIDIDAKKVDTYWDGEQSLADGFNKFYRPDAEDRKRVEKHGFKSDYTGVLSYVEAERRHLSLKLHLFRPSDIIYSKKDEGERTFMQKVMHWLMGY